MRILWHGIAPWHKTGYGVQCALFAPLLAGLGHEVVIARMGFHTDKHAEQAERWQGIKVIGPGRSEFAMPSRAEIRAAFGGHDPDLVLVLKDAWVLNPKDYLGYTTAVWCNIDCEPMGGPDLAFFEASGAFPVAVSKWGRAQMRAAGLGGAGYVPHGIDLEVWTPGDKAEARRLLGLPEKAFIAGMDAANVGMISRKAFPEQFSAFAEFRKRFDKRALLLCHTHPEHPEGINLRVLAARLGIEDGVLFPSQWNMTTGQMLTWYRSLDVYLGATYGEGFGVPIIQALACDVPVIGTDCSAISEKVPHGAGWLVAGQRFWNPHFGAWWTVPAIGQITAALGQAEAGVAKAPRAHAAPYDAAEIARTWWKPLLEKLAA